MSGSGTVTAFAGERLLASGPRGEVALAIRAGGDGGVLVFDDETGAQIDLDLRGPVPEPAAAPAGPIETGPKGPGRPKLGVVSREVTLLPRHWEWLAGQPGGASVTLRKLVDAARRADAHEGGRRRAREAADRFMGAMLGNAPHYEDATRALYRGDRASFLSLTQDWPADPRDHARRLAAASFPDVPGGEPT